MLEYLSPAKVPMIRLEEIDKPFTSLGSSQYGIVPNRGSTPSPAKGAWSATGSGHSPSPPGRRGYLRGTAAELRARNAREHKTEEQTSPPKFPELVHELVKDEMRLEEPKTSSAPELAAPDVHEEAPSVHDSSQEFVWDSRMLDMVNNLVQQHEKTIFEHNLTIQTLVNKVALLMDEDIVHKQSLRRQRYNMSQTSSAENSLVDGFNALETKQDSEHEDFPYSLWACAAGRTPHCQTRISNCPPRA